MVVALIVAVAGIELRQDQVAIGFVLTLLAPIWRPFSVRITRTARPVAQMFRRPDPRAERHPGRRHDLLQPAAAGLFQLYPDLRDLVRPVSHAPRAGAPRRRRAPGSRFRARHECQPPALPLHGDWRRAGRHGGRGLLAGDQAGLDDAAGHARATAGSRWRL